MAPYGLGLYRVEDSGLIVRSPRGLGLRVSGLVLGFLREGVFKGEGSLILPRYSEKAPVGS